MRAGLLVAAAIGPYSIVLEMTSSLPAAINAWLWTGPR